MTIKRYQTNLECSTENYGVISIDFDQQQGLFPRSDWSDTLGEKYPELTEDEMDSIMENLDQCYTNDVNFFADD